MLPFLGFSVGQLHHLCDELNRSVRTVHLAYAASDALMATLFIVFKRELSPEPICYFQGCPVLRITLGDFWGDEFFTGDGHAGHEAFQPAPNFRKIFLDTTHLLKL